MASPILYSGDSIQTNQPIPVYIIETSSSDRGEAVRRFFNHSSFNVYIVRVDTPQHVAGVCSGTTGSVVSSCQDGMDEAWSMMWCLRDAVQRSPTSSIILIKDTSIITVSQDQLAAMMSFAITTSTSDLIYLNRWQDRCDLYSDRVPIPGTGSQLVRTYSPHGCQAMIIAPTGRDRLLSVENADWMQHRPSMSTYLNHAISEGDLTASCFVPNVVTFDLDAARHPDEYYKLQECRAPPETNVAGPTSGPVSSFIVWIVVIAAILVLLLVGYRCLRRSRYSSQ